MRIANATTAVLTCRGDIAKATARHTCTHHLDPARPPAPQSNIDKHGSIVTSRWRIARTYGGAWSERGWTAGSAAAGAGGGAGAEVPSGGAGTEATIVLSAGAARGVPRSGGAPSMLADVGRDAKPPGAGGTPAADPPDDPASSADAGAGAPAGTGTDAAEETECTTGGSGGGGGAGELLPAPPAVPAPAAKAEPVPARASAPGAGVSGNARLGVGEPGVMRDRG